MNRISRLFFRSLGIALVTWAGFNTGVCHAISFTVTIDTRPLAGQTTPPAPFALEFQFNDGDGTVNNTATLSNFNFGTGGAAVGTPTYNCTSGSGAACSGITGDLSSTVTLSDNSDFFNEFIQQFTPSSSDPLSFLLNLTTNVEPITPDLFSLAIFDSSGTEIPTSFFDVFVQIDITNPLTIATYASDATQSPPGCSTCAPINIAAPLVQSSTPIPEPGTLFLFGSGLAGLITWRRCQQNRRQG